MKKILLSATAIAAFTSAAIAADLPSRRAPPVYVPPPPVFTWTGFYAGFNVGADFNGYTDYTLFGAGAGGTAGGIATGARPAFADTRSTGFAGGGQIGYNFQIDGGLFGSTFGAVGSGLSPVFGGSYGGIVAGVEADIDGTTNKASANVFGTTGLDTFLHSRTDFVGTVRGRLGYAFGNLWIYGTGGFAYGDVRDNEVLMGAGVPGAAALNRIQTGYAYGGGVEYAIPTTSFVNFFKASAVTVKAEFIHYNLTATNGIAVPGTAGPTSYIARIHNDGNIARLGVNYKFGTPAAPVVARY